MFSSACQPSRLDRPAFSRAPCGAAVKHDQLHFWRTSFTTHSPVPRRNNEWQLPAKVSIQHNHHVNFATAAKAADQIGPMRSEPAVEKCGPNNGDAGEHAWTILRHAVGIYDILTRSTVGSFAASDAHGLVRSSLDFLSV